MNERDLPKYNLDKYHAQMGSPIDPSELNPSTFVNGIAPAVLEPTYIGAPSRTGKADNILVITDNVVQDFIPKGYEHVIVIAPGNAQVESIDSPEDHGQPADLDRDILIQQLGKVSGISSIVPSSHENM